MMVGNTNSIGLYCAQPASILCEVIIVYLPCRDFSGRIRSAGFQGGAIAENIANGHTSAFDVVANWMW